MNTSDNNNNNLVHQFASPQAPPSKDHTAFISPTTVFPDDTNVNAINTADCILNLPPNRTAYPAVNTIHSNNNNNNTTASAATTDVEMAAQCILAGDILSPSVATTTSTVSSPAINTDNPTITTTTNNNSIGGMDLGATTLICDALQYVLVHEGRAFRNLESLALSHGFVPTTGIMNETASQRLIRALITGRSSASYNDAVKKIETCLGKWVVHNYTYKYTTYCAKNNEAAVLTNTSNNSNMLFDAWMANISDWAKGEKVRYKQVLDARKDALDGILGLERARLVNNQKSAHLSKFQSNLIEQGKTCLIQWLIEDKYSTLINVAYFKQRIDK